MQTNFQAQRTINSFAENDHLSTWIEAFLIDRKAGNAAKGTLYFYRMKLALFVTFCDGQLISQVTQITPSTLREFLLWLAGNGHNPGGVHGCYRAVKAFLRWWEQETEPEAWRNPIRKVKAPKVNLEPLEPANMDDVQAMLRTCKGGLLAERDKALMLTLLDTGARAAELLAMDIDDLNPITGELLIRLGKGRKSRTVYLGQTARRQVRKYLKARADNNPCLWVTDDGGRLCYWGLRSLVARRAGLAGVPAPELHSFRRAFALSMLRAGTDVFTLQKLMGHADLQILRRYLAQTDDDLKAAHNQGGPVDRLSKQ